MQIIFFNQITLLNKDIYRLLSLDRDTFNQQITLLQNDQTPERLPTLENLKKYIKDSCQDTILFFFPITENLLDIEKISTPTKINLTIITNSKQEHR